MKLITLNQLISSLETTKGYIDEAIGNISTGSNIDTDNLVITNSISIGRREDTTVGAGSVAVGYDTEASGENSYAEGYEATASGDYSHAEGESTTASGISSHAEGNSTTASEYCSHAEGGSTTASGYYSHAEGSRTEASNYYSHAEGANTIASGEGSHAEGYLTIASSDYQHVQGKWNIEDSANTYAHIVGNGSSSARSNAHTLDWNGNAWFAGNVKVGADNKELATTDHTHNYLPLTGGTLTGNLTVSNNLAAGTIVGETKFIDSTSTTYSDPWNGTLCAIKATGNIACTGEILANGDLETKGNLYTRGAATFDDFAYINSWNCDNETYGDFFGQGILYAKNDTTSTNVTSYRDPYFAVEFCEYPSFTGTFFHLYLDYILTQGNIMPYNSNTYTLGNSSLRWKYIYSNDSLNTSDREEKENIVYIRDNDEAETVSEISDITYNSLYSFVRDDLELATYNLKCDEEKPDINFIAQDLLYNIDGTNNTIGQIIVPPIPAPTDEEAQKYEEVDENGNKTCSPPTLSYDLGNYISVLAGALKEAINKIESQQSIIDDLMIRLNKIENQ